MAHFIDLSRAPFEGERGTRFLIQWLIDNDMRFIIDFKGGRASERIDTELKRLAPGAKWLKIEQDDDFKRLCEACDGPRLANGAAGYPAHPRKILGHLRDIMDASEVNPEGEK